MSRPLSPIERMIDQACGIGPGLPAPRRTIVLRCPSCGESNTVYRDKIDPPKAELVVYPCGCGGCPGGPDHELRYYDADGRELDLETGEPTP